MDSGKFVHRRKRDILPIKSGAPKDNQRIFEANNKSLELSKVISLFRHPLTANLKNRHLFVLKKLLQRNQTGFLLKELPHLAQILNICAEKVIDNPEYVPFLCEALRICGFPFLKEKASDELTYTQEATEFLSDMGCLMKVPQAEVRQQIVESVKSFYVGAAPRQLHDGLQPISPGYRLQLLERSDLAHTLLLSMAAVEHQSAIRLQLLQTLQILSSSSDIYCVSILHARGAETICLHMNEPDPSGQLLLSSCEILWNLLKSCNTEEVTAQLSSIECVTSLKEAFLQQNSSQQGDLQLKNDLLMITTLIAENTSSLLIESLFARQLIALATFPELKSNKPLVENLKPTFTREDFRMKKLLLNLLVYMSKDLATLQLYKEENVVLSLLTLMKPPAALSERGAGSHHWSSMQQEELQLQALAILATIAPLMLDDYMSYQGNTCLLILLDWCVRQDSLLGQGLSFQGTESSRKALVQHCIRVMRSVTSSGVNIVNQDLCDQGIINQLLGMLMQMEVSPDKDDVITLEIKSDIQLILSVLCESDMHRKELFGSEGVEMAVHFLGKGSSNFYSGLGHNKLLLSTLDCVRSCIVGCYTTEDYFLAKKGVCLLLDLLSSSPKCLHCTILATLIELYDNPNTQSYVLSWRGDGGETAPGLLLQLWREQEEDLKVSRNQHGGIADPKKPLHSLYQQEDTKYSFPAKMASAAVLEMSENLRSKIYSIFCKLGFQDLPGLSAKHYVTLGIVKKYLDFKVGEVWEEIGKELTLDGVRPVTPDMEVLDAIREITEDKARRVAAEQKNIMEQQEKEEIREEDLLYSEINSRLKQQELAAKSWDNYVSKTSNYEILKEVRAQREKRQESSRSKPKIFVGQVMSIETTDTPGPAGVKVVLARAALSTQPEHLSTRSGNN